MFGFFEIVTNLSTSNHSFSKFKSSNNYLIRNGLLNHIYYSHPFTFNLFALHYFNSDCGFRILCFASCCSLHTLAMIKFLVKLFIRNLFFISAALNSERTDRMKLEWWFVATKLSKMLFLLPFILKWLIDWDILAQHTVPLLCLLRKLTLPMVGAVFCVWQMIWKVVIHRNPAPSLRQALEVVQAQSMEL